jgi:E3 ubiquitin-protein ligase RNF14
LAPCANLATRWRNADEQGREELRRKYGKSVVDEVESAEWMLKHTKPCPNCSTSVEKNGGCNHITCRHCNFEWCWLCNCKYQPGHYRKGSGTGCEQFSQDFFDELDLTREEFDARFVVLNHM